MLLGQHTHAHTREYMQISVHTQICINIYTPLNGLTIFIALDQETRRNLTSFMVEFVILFILTILGNVQEYRNFIKPLYFFITQRFGRMPKRHIMSCCVSQKLLLNPEGQLGPGSSITLLVFLQREKQDVMLGDVSEDKLIYNGHFTQP